MWYVSYCIPTFSNGHCISILWIFFLPFAIKLFSNNRCPIVLVYMITTNRAVGFEFGFSHALNARVKLIYSNFAHSKIHIAEARVELKSANCESFPYIMHIVDEPRKFSPSNVLTYTVLSSLE